MVRGAPVCQKEDFWFTFQANQLIFGPGQDQVRRECVETVNQVMKVSCLTSQSQ